jgi:hypothetical protein
MLIKVRPFDGSAAAGIIIVNQFTVRNMENFNTKSWGFRQLLVKLYHTQSKENS